MPSSIDLASISGSKPTTRNDARTFFNLAEKVEVLSREHVPDDEAGQFYRFKGLVETKLELKWVGGSSAGRYFESDHGIW